MLTRPAAGEPVAPADTQSAGAAASTGRRKRKPPSAPAARLPVARVLPLLTPAHLDRDFDYLVPAEFDELARPGVRVRVRFARLLVDGYLLERLERSEHTGKLIALERVVSGEQVLTPEILRLATIVAARYAGTRADVLRLAVPPRHGRTENGSAKAGAASSTTEEAEGESNSVSDPPSAAGAPGVPHAADRAGADGQVTAPATPATVAEPDRKSTRLNSSHV